MGEYVGDKLKEIFETTIESGIKYEGSVDKLDYFALFCQAVAKDQMYKLMGNNLCMFNCQIENKDAVMVIFSIAINSPEESGAKSVAERVMEVVRELEETFTTLDYLRSNEVKEDKFVYVTALKKLNGG